MRDAASRRSASVSLMIAAGAAACGGAGEPSPPRVIDNANHSKATQEDSSMPTELELSCGLKNDQVKSGDPIVLHVELANRGPTPQPVNGRLGLSAPQRGGEVSLEIHNQTGKVIPLSARINIGQPSDQDLRLLAPQAHVRREIKVGDYFNLR